MSRTYGLKFQQNDPRNQASNLQVKNDYTREASKCSKSDRHSSGMSRIIISKVKVEVVIAEAEVV